MKFSIREQLALIYTSAGSMRNVAGLVGVSHQKIGRALHSPENGGYKETSRALSDPGFIAAVKVAFSIHVDISRQQARADGLPFDPSIPVYSRRLAFVDNAGEIRPGLRVLADHTHWLTNEQRAAWISFEKKSNIYNNVSVGSYVDLLFYFERGEDYWKHLESRGQFRTPEQEKSRRSIAIKIARNIERAWIYTPKTPLDGFPISQVIADITRKLRAKHEPAATDPKAKVAGQIVLQIKSRHDAATNKRKTRTSKKPTRAKRR